MSKITDRNLHVEVANVRHLAGILRPRGVHALTGLDAHDDLALAADLTHSKHIEERTAVSMRIIVRQRRA